MSEDFVVFLNLLDFITEKPQVHLRLYLRFLLFDLNLLNSCRMLLFRDAVHSLSIVYSPFSNTRQSPSLTPSGSSASPISQKPPSPSFSQTAMEPSILSTENFMAYSPFSVRYSYLSPSVATTIVPLRSVLSTFIFTASASRSIVTL